MPVTVNRVADAARAAKPNAAVVGGALKATGLLPRALPKTSRATAVKPEMSKRLAEAPSAAAKPVRPAAPAVSPSFGRMAACMRFRSYIS